MILTRNAASLIIRSVPRRCFGMLSSVPMGPPDKILGLNVLFKVRDCNARR